MDSLGLARFTDADLVAELRGRESRSLGGIAKIKRTVCRHFGLTLQVLRGPARHQRVAHPRQIAMYLAHRAGHSYPRIGAAFGGRHHTTVLHACRVVEARAAEDEEVAAALALLRVELAKGEAT